MRNLCRPREGGDPVFFKKWGSRLRGNDELALLKSFLR
jgi:hypothetical protein